MAEGGSHATTDGAHPAQPPTIHDVARKAGVSTSTVSRVLDDRLPRSRSAAADRVREAARALGYSPDPSASSLRRGGTSTIGVLVPRLTDIVMAMLFDAIATACEQRGRFAVVSRTHDDPEIERHAAESLLKRRVDGLILTTARVDGEFAAELRRRQVPHVLALRTDGVSPSSVADDEMGGYLATRHLLDLGHRAIGLVGGPDYASSSLRRREGYRRALAEAGVTPRPEWVCPSAFSMEAGETIGRRLLSAESRPSAIFAVNDNTAVGVMAAAHNLGLRVPADVSVVGYNDIPLASRLPIPLTTVRVPFHEIAANALELLITPGDRAETRRSSTPALIPRASAAAYR